MELEEVPDVTPAANEDVMVQQFQDAQVLPVEEGYHDVRLPVCFGRWLDSFSFHDHPGQISPGRGSQFLLTRDYCRVLRAC